MANTYTMSGQSCRRIVKGGDVVYNQCRMDVGDTTPEKSEKLDRGAGLLSGAEPNQGCLMFGIPQA